jgi:hypothetical protein
LANTHGKTVRVPLEKRLSKGSHGNNTPEPSDKSQTASATQPKFGVYTVPNLYTRVFIGPYGLREDAGVSAIKIINGRLVNTMYLDPQHGSLDDNDESITALLESGGKEAVLNMKMEQMYDSIARAPEDTRVCRGMWLYTTRSEDKAWTVRNIMATPISVDGNIMSSAKASLVSKDRNRSSTSAKSPTTVVVTEIIDKEQKTAMDMNKPHTYLQEERFLVEKNDSKLYSETGHAAQHSLTDDTATDSRKEGSRPKQTLNVQNGACRTATCKNISVHEVPKNVGKECDEEEGEMKQSAKDSPLMAITESGSSTRDAISSVKSDNDEHADVEKPCHAGTPPHKTCLLPSTKRVDCKRIGKNENNSLQKCQKQMFHESTDSAASVHR